MNDLQGKKKSCRLCAAKVFSLKLGNPAVAMFCAAGTTSVFPLYVMQEGNKACGISGCALQNNIKITLFLGPGN